MALHLIYIHPSTLILGGLFFWNSLTYSKPEEHKDKSSQV